MARPLMLLASPLAIVAYYMLASVLTSYIAIRLIRTWGLVGRLVATFSRKERLPITLSESSTPAPVTTSWKEHAQNSYIKWTARLLARLKVPAPRLPHLAHQRIELPILKEDETVQLEEARPKAEEPPLLVDLGDMASPMLGVFAGTSNVSACPTPDIRLHRHLPSPIPWRPGTTPPFSSSSSKFSTDPPRLPTTPPPAFAPLSPFASPKHMLKGRQRESFEMNAFSQPLIQFSPVASPVPRVLFPHDGTRTPSPVHHSPNFLSNSPPSPFRPRRAMSLGGATVKKLPSLEVGMDGRIDGAWEPGRSGLLVDLERSGDEAAQPAVTHYQAPTPIQPRAVAAFSLEVDEGPRRSSPPPLTESGRLEGFLPTFMAFETATMLHQQDGEFGLFDNPFGGELENVAATTVSTPIALEIDWEMDLEGNGLPSSTISTPVVVDYPDAIFVADEAALHPLSPTSSTLGDSLPREAARPFVPDTTLQPADPPQPTETQSLDAMENETGTETFPDPEDLPLPSDQDLIPRFPDPGLPELPSFSDIQHSAGLLLIIFCSLASFGDEGQADNEDPDHCDTADDKICHSTVQSLSTQPVSIVAKEEPATPLPESVADVPVPALNVAIVQSGLVALETPSSSIVNHSVEVPEESQGVTVGQSPEPVASQGSEGVGPTAVSDASAPIVNAPDAAKPANPRQRALSGGFSAAIAETWRRGKASPLDIALAMQMRPGLGVGADPAFMVRFLMAAFGWFVIVVNGGID